MVTAPPRQPWIALRHRPTSLPLTTFANSSSTSPSQSLSAKSQTSFLPGPVARRACELSSGAEALLTDAVDRFALTGRGFDRAIKVGRTIADLAGEDRIDAEHLAEALSYRTGFGTEALADAV